MKRRALQLISLFLVFCSLAGCFFSSVDELYSLPELSEQYKSLQKKINEVIKSGAAYFAPTSGSNRGSVQLQDVNGDGVQEALAFFMIPGDKPLKVYIYRSTADGFELAAQIEGDGTAINEVSYADLDGDGCVEIVVGWQISDELKTASVYSVAKDFSKVSELFSAHYSEYVLFDIDGDKRSELTAINYNATETTGRVSTYKLLSGGGEVTSYAEMSKGVNGLRRVKTGYLRNMVPALFVTGAYADGGSVTDIFGMYAGKIVNVTTLGGNETSPELIAYSSIYPTDINRDGIMDLPKLRSLPVYSGDQSYWVINWHSYNVRGISKETMTTYHDYYDGWYLQLPSEWADALTVRRVSALSGVSTVVFSLWNGEKESPTDFLKIYTLTGDNRRERANITGRFILANEANTIFAAQILVDKSAWEYAPTEAEVRENFELIYNEWVTGIIS